MRIKIGFGLVACLMLFAAGAFADSYSLNLDGCTGTCGGGPYGTVYVTDNGTNSVHILVDLNSNVGFVQTGSADALDFNIIGNPTISISNLTSGFSLLSATAGSYHTGNFGNFDYAITCNSCGSGGSNPYYGDLSFDVSATGLTKSSFESNGSAYFVVDLMGSNGNTGPVGTNSFTPGTGTTVPEPTSVLLLGSGLIALAMTVARRKK